MPLIKGLPDWALYAGGGAALGGGYLLYKKRKAASAQATTAPTSTYDSSSLTNASTSSQQPSIVPYYLTQGSGQDWRSQGGKATTTGPPLPTPSGPPGANNVDTTGTVLPPIPPLLPNVNTQTNIPQPTAPTPAPTPAPAPTQNNNIPADLLAKITANGERIVNSVAAPNGGVWYLGSKGGVFAINAPFYGAPAGQGYWGGRTGLQIVPNGQGYTVIASSGERYNYGP